VLGAPIADTHAHLDMFDDPAGSLERAALARVGLVVTVADATESPEATFDGLSGWIEEAARRLRAAGSEASVPQVRIILGVHPHNAKDFDDSTEQTMLRLSADPRVVGIGEIGLDYHYDHSPRDRQREVFRRQLAFAHRCGQPVIVHLREAHDDGAKILGELGLPDGGCIIHCFTGDADLAARFVEMGCYVSFAGPVTFKKAEAIRQAAASVPLDRLLSETDAPFMAPEPHRGKTNEPAWTAFTVARIAGARGEDPATVAAALYGNACRVFHADAEG
jgi:TatD DNase family protein